MGFKKACVIGIGLMGASLALAMRKKGIARSVIGSGRNASRLDAARRKGIIDSYETDPAKAVEGADLVMLASPVGTFREISAMIARSLKKGALVMDMGSVKGKLAVELEVVLHDARFIGCHPIAGSERSGFEYADAGLFEGALCVITPTEKTPEPLIEEARSFWESLGMRVAVMTPSEHDRVFGLVSHLPHLIAFELVNLAASLDEDALKMAGRGFLDTTRIAASPASLWADISMQNRENLVGLLEKYRDNIEALCRLLRSGDAPGLRERLQAAGNARRRLGED